MKLLVWHWGRHGAGPIFAVELAQAFKTLPDTQVVLSMAAGAEALPSFCDWREPTYRNAAGYAAQRLLTPLHRSRIAGKLRETAPDFAICAMPALLDDRMTAALRAQNIPYAVLVHDAAAHPGDGLRFRLGGQGQNLRHAACLFTLSAHVEAGLRRQGFAQPITKLWHPPIYYGDVRPPFAHGGKPRLLSFGRLLPYKGLDLLADALGRLSSPLPFDVKICGDGPASPELARLAAMPGVEVDHRWIPESEMRGLIEWSDAVVLPYREASQSGVAAAAIGQGRLVVATEVGGLPEQLAGLPGAILCQPNAAAIAEALLRIRPSALPASREGSAANWSAMAARLCAALPG